MARCGARAPCARVRVRHLPTPTNNPSLQPTAYSIAVSYRADPAGGGNPAVATRTVGFRTAHLVTTNDTACAASSLCATGSGTGDHTMRMKVGPGKCER